MKLPLDYRMRGKKNEAKTVGDYEVSCSREYIKYRAENYTNQRTCNDL